MLVLNCGSSSVKFALIDPVSESTLLSGLAQRIGTKDADIIWKYQGNKEIIPLNKTDYFSVLKLILNKIQATGDFAEQIVAVGHRVVHGGEDFAESVVIDDKVLDIIKNCSYLAPLHNPANITGIEVAKQEFNNVPHVAVFDTAFHQTMPQYAYIYPIPYKYYTEYKVRRYGFHGTSHNYVSKVAAHRLNIQYEKSAFITAHLGNGCSLAAVSNGKSVDTSMGFTPLEGLMMGTRSGDVDPSLHSFLAEKLGCDIATVTNILNKKSGLLGVSQLNSDLRAIENSMAAGDTYSALAFEIFCYRLSKYIAAFLVPLGSLDALVFTGGIGENSDLVRARTLKWLQVLGLQIDEASNAVHGKNNNGIITRQGSKYIAIVIPTNEELAIAQETILFV